MIYGSICSGIEAATVAWHPLGWKAAFYSEIDAFPRAVLQHHYPVTPLHGDFTTIEANQYAAINVLVGGTPCQSFSVAGLRKGLDDDRGNLALEFCLLARRLRPRWVIWENVPGVLSLDEGRAFASILGGLAECGYGLAYRVLDAQYVRVDGFARAVPQRRRRVFVVGYLGDWRRAAAVLFERESLRWDTPPSRQAGQGIAHSVTARAGNGSRPAGGTGNIVADVAPCMRAGGNETGGDRPYGTDVDTCDSLVARCQTSSNQRIDAETENIIPVAHTLSSEGHDASEDGTGRGIPLIPQFATFMPARTFGADGGVDERFAERDVCDALHTSSGNGNKAPMVAFNWNAQPDQMNFDEHTTPTLSCSQGAAAFLGWRVRRLTPVECERLQGFTDGFYTAVPYRGRPAADGPRYKAIGNSMAVNAMRWLGSRIQMVDAV